MRIHSITFAILSSLVLVACGGSAKNLGDAKDPGGDPWKDYKGTYATTANPKIEGASADKPTAKASKAKAEAKPAAAPAPAPAKDDAEAAAEAALAEANAQPEPTMTAEPAPKKGAKAAPKRAAKKAPGKK
jgi:hypothetical protein